jgi:hypothetical protein
VSDAFVAKLTERKGLTPAQIRTAVRFAGLAHVRDGGRGGETFEALIERQLKNADAALGNPLTQRQNSRRSPPTTWTCSTSKAASRFRASSRP